MISLARLGDVPLKLALTAVTDARTHRTHRTHLVTAPTAPTWSPTTRLPRAARPGITKPCAA